MYVYSHRATEYVADYVYVETSIQKIDKGVIKDMLVVSSWIIHK